MKKFWVLISVLIFSFNSFAFQINKITQNNVDVKLVSSCIEIAIDLANIQLENGDINQNEYFAAIQHFMSICNETEL